MARIMDFYYDVGSTNSYFALFSLAGLEARTGVNIRFQPLNLGYLFRSNNYVLADEPRAKLSNRRRDLQRWARWLELPFRMPDTFPIKTSRALRGALAMRQVDRERDYIEAVFRAYWEEGIVVEDFPALKEIVRGLGEDPDRFEAASEAQDVRGQMIEIHENAIARGVFGAPTFIVGDEIFWGKDRLDFVERELLDMQVN